MAWTMFESRFRTHPKSIAVGPLGRDLFRCSVEWSAEQLTDGYVPVAVLQHLAPGLASPVEVAQSLVTAGLWHVEDEHGWRIHDYHQYNPTKAQVLRNQAHLKMIRARAGKVGGVASGQARRRSKHEANESKPQATVAKQNEAPTPTPTPTPRTTTTPAPQRAAVPPNPEPKKPKPAVQETAIREVVKHWAAAFLAHRGVEPVIAWPKVCGQLKPVVLAHGPERTKALLDAMFVSTDRLILDSDYGIGVFLNRVNKLAAQQSSNGHSAAVAAIHASNARALAKVGRPEDRDARE